MSICDPSFIYVPETASTNTCLKALNRQQILKEGTVVYTSNQVSGRGQVGTSWESEPGKNLTFSIILFPQKIPVNRQFILSQLVSLAVRDVLSEAVDFISVKWPNDIYYKNQKIAGILIENDIEGDSISVSIMGIGLNVNQRVFLSDAPNPVSLCQITNKEYDLQLLMQRIVDRLLFLYEEVNENRQDDIISRYKESLYRKDGYHLFSDKNGIFMATIEDIEPAGAIVLRTKEGERRKYLFKEVTLKIP
ncbi:MAG: biotin--[acetyl-CoA-carboxylase] ligase [Dysgonamonadaceae bacterium]|jgi:BirA family biotin operon repressor/biotin-[acetyl-CoA-carboxylase] ligase|nr:biotin--[acetyl-CoA-carboxylase] ligase [Dysgonamonadaceae bacterium]